MHEGTIAPQPRLLAVAHGTASPAGRATTDELMDALRAARPDVPVELCFLDVARPRLVDALGDARTVVVPVLLSTGYHVQTDIPAAIAGRPGVVLARHLGPHPLLVAALLDRLPVDPDGTYAGSTVLLGAGSSRDAARAELDETAALLAQRLGRRVDVLTMADDLTTELRRRPPPVEVATYLLAEGRFTETLERAAAGAARVAGPLGAHPAVVELVWSRYDEAVAVARGTGRAGVR